MTEIANKSTPYKKNDIKNLKCCENKKTSLRTKIRIKYLKKSISKGKITLNEETKRERLIK